MKNIKVLLISLFMFTACSSDSSDESFSYDLTQNGCKTEKQTFSSLADMCHGLTNDSLNNFCAHKLRCDKFKADCAGQDIDTSCTSSED